ncbi:MAG: hypothetical protein PHH30_02810 [Bacteroidales bacterium]|nr:hypothetical protein [Bacteroidales bacterium]MDD3858855.1 hypothetical protein [Bacteroidales bacterium]
MEKNIIIQIKEKSDINKIVSQIIKNPEQIENLINVVENEKGSIKFGCEKILRLVSEQKPELIYPYFDFFVKLLDNENKFLKWGAIITISNLAIKDNENKFEKIFEKYYAPIKGSVMVTAANEVGNSDKIIQAKPELKEKIIDKILEIEKAKYIHKGALSPECKNVVCGHAIDTFEKIYNQTLPPQKVIVFVKKQLKNSRDKVRKKAEKFIKRVNEN